MKHYIVWYSSEADGKVLHCQDGVYADRARIVDGVLIFENFQRAPHPYAEDAWVVIQGYKNFDLFAENTKLNQLEKKP